MHESTAVRFFFFKVPNVGLFIMAILWSLEFLKSLTKLTFDDFETDRKGHKVPTSPLCTGTGGEDGSSNQLHQQRAVVIHLPCNLYMAPVLCLHFPRSH